MAEFNIVVVQSTSGKEITMSVEQEFTLGSVLEVLVENLQLKDRFVLATEDNKILSPETTISESGLQEGSKILLIPDPTGG
ncbi:MAG TPA: hypothetical protein VJI71_02775 [Candidatus Norongarragalinales archaeon]|nr:hypothetical protein [Candidatus Norongarragalinales archaeon]